MFLKHYLTFYFHEFKRKFASRGRFGQIRKGLTMTADTPVAGSGLLRGPAPGNNGAFENHTGPVEATEKKRAPRFRRTR